MAFMGVSHVGAVYTGAHKTGATESIVLSYVVVLCRVHGSFDPGDHLDEDASAVRASFNTRMMSEHRADTRHAPCSVAAMDEVQPRASDCIWWQ